MGLSITPAWVRVGLTKDLGVISPDGAWLVGVVHVTVAGIRADTMVVVDVVDAG